MTITIIILNILNKITNDLRIKKLKMTLKKVKNKESANN